MSNRGTARPRKQCTISQFRGLRRHTMASVSIAALMASAPVAALAQGEADAGEGARLEEIVVTAQKREQRLQDVPVAITAVSAETIEANRITSVRDLSALAPNLLVRTQPGGGSNPGYTMRGYINTGSAAGTDRGLALYVDGVFLGNPNGSIFELADIQRVEVLRGPQGTLFGRNSTAGAINFITAEPSADFGVKVTASVGNYAQKRLKAQVNTGQLGMFSAMLNYSHAERRGDIRNLGAGTTWNFTPAFNGIPTFYTAPSHLGGNDQDSFGVTVKVEPTDNFKTVYRYDHSVNDYTGEGFGTIYLQPLTRGLLVGQPNPALLTQISRERPKAVNNYSVPGHMKSWGHSLTSDFQASDSLSFKNIFANRKSYYLSPWSDFGSLGGLVNTGGGSYIGLLGAAVASSTIGAPFVLQGASTYANDTQWSDEFQVNYDSKLVTLTMGALYYSQTQRRGQAGVDAGIGRARSPSRGVYPGFVVPFAGQPQLAGGQGFKVKVKSKAVYGQAEVHVLEQLDLIGGVRYTKDRKEGLDASTVSLLPNARVPNVIDYEGDKVTYNLGVNYKLTPDKLIYAKYSTGYISGGALSAITYNPEIAKSLEGGVKADWLNGSLRTNLAVFQTKYIDLQASVSGVLLGRPEITNSLGNVGDAKVKGVELETSYSPIRNLVFTANGGYLDFKYTRVTALLSTGVSETLPIYRPKWTGNVSAQYTTNPLFGDATLTARVDGNYRSAQWGISSVPNVSAASGFTAVEQARFRAEGRIKGYWLWNARVALQDINLGQARGTLALWGRNLGNDKSPTLMQSIVLAISTSYEPARTVGLDFTVEF
jgi:iron complex outermembrane receptor protein